MLKQVIDDYAASLNRKWAHDRTQTVGASEIGLCARKTFWMKNEKTSKGVPRDDDYEDQYGAWVRGVIMEDAFWVPVMRARYGDNLLNAGDEQQTARLGNLSCTPDALIINQPKDALKDLGIIDIGATCFMAEGKTIDPRTNIVEAKTENIFQAQVQLGLTRELTEHKPIYNVITYTDASFWSEIIEFPVEFDPKIFQAAKDRATAIMTADSGRDMPPEGWIAGGKECSFCPFVKACGVERRSVPKNNAAASPQFIAEITDYCKEAKEIEAVIDVKNAQLKERQQLIRDRLREKGVRRIVGVVNWYPVAGAVRYSATKMRDYLTSLGEDVDQFAKTGEDQDRLVIAAIPAATRMPKQLTAIVKRKKPKAKPKSKTTKSKSKTSKAKSAKTGKKKSK